MLWGVRKKFVHHDLITKSQHNIGTKLTLTTDTKVVILNGNTQSSSSSLQRESVRDYLTQNIAVIPANQQFVFIAYSGDNVAYFYNVKNTDSGNALSGNDFSASGNLRVQPVLCLGIQINALSSNTFGNTVNDGTDPDTVSQS